MKIIYKKIKELNPAEYNPRKMTDKEAADLTESIKRFGFAEPIIINEHPDRKNVIVGGHQRVEVAKRLGMSEVPCVFVSLPFEKEQELNLRLNKNLGSWNYDWLANINEELLQDVGFTSDEMDKIFDLTPEPDIDDIPEVPKEPESKLGEIYQLGPHRLMCGDSTKKEDIEKLMDGKKADVVFTDPPYGILYIPENKKLASLGYLKSDTKDANKFKDFVDSLVGSIIYLLKDGGVYYIFMSWEFMGDIVNKLKELNADGHNLLVWDRVKVHFRSYPQDYIPNCEFFLYGWKKGKNRVKNFKTGLEHTTIWRYETLRSKEMVHTTEKPVALAKNAIMKSSKRDDIIVDLFGGSGSTLMAAEEANRICYMMEFDPKYCDVIRNRYEIYTRDTK